MKRNAIIPLVLAGMACWAVAAPGQAPASPAAYAVVAGDILHIEVYAGGLRQEDVQVTVSPAGTIMLPLLGEWRVVGMAVAEIAEKTRQALNRDYYVEPKVLVSVLEHVGKVFIAGEVRRPGVYPVQTGLTVLQACDLAGGTTDFSAPGRVTITRVRGGRTERLRVNLAKVRKGLQPDVALQDGDRVEVPQRWF